MTVRDVVIWMYVRGAELPNGSKNPLTCTVVKTRFQRNLPIIEFETAQGELLWVQIASIALVEMGQEREV